MLWHWPESCICFWKQQNKYSHLWLFWKRLETTFEEKIFLNQWFPHRFLGDLSCSFGAKRGVYFWAAELWFSPKSLFCYQHPTSNAKKNKLENCDFIIPHLLSFEMLEPNQPIRLREKKINELKLLLSLWSGNYLINWIVF